MDDFTPTQYRRRNDPATFAFSLRLTRRERTHLEQVASERNVSMSRVLRLLIEDDIKQRKSVPLRRS